MHTNYVIDVSVKCLLKGEQLEKPAGKRAKKSPQKRARTESVAGSAAGSANGSATGPVTGPATGPATEPAMGSATGSTKGLTNGGSPDINVFVTMADGAMVNAFPGEIKNEWKLAVKGGADFTRLPSDPIRDKDGVVRDRPCYGSSQSVPKGGMSPAFILY